MRDGEAFSMGTVGRDRRRPSAQAKERRTAGSNFIHHDKGRLGLEFDVDQILMDSM
jgi:hypothetical protein